MEYIIFTGVGYRLRDDMSCGVLKNHVFCKLMCLEDVLNYGSGNFMYLV